MRLFTLRAVLIATLASYAALALADHERGNGRRFPNPASLEWRLGNGNDIYFRGPGDRRWQRAPGSAVDIGEGWVIGTNRKKGGYGIFRWSGWEWQRMPGAGIEIGGSYRSPWVINDRGERYRWNGNEWRADYSVGLRDSHRDTQPNRDTRRDAPRRDNQDERHDQRHESPAVIGRSESQQLREVQQSAAPMNHEAPSVIEEQVFQVEPTAPAVQATNEETAPQEAEPTILNSLSDEITVE